MCIWVGAWGLTGAHMGVDVCVCVCVLCMHAYSYCLLGDIYMVDYSI